MRIIADAQVTANRITQVVVLRQKLDGKFRREEYGDVGTHQMREVN